MDTNLHTLGITKLKEIARGEGVIGYGKYRSDDKRELIKLILRTRKINQDKSKDTLKMIKNPRMTYSRKELGKTTSYLLLPERPTKKSIYHPYETTVKSFHQPSTVESKYLTLKDQIYVMSVSDVFGLENTPKIPTNEGMTLTIRIGANGYKLLPRGERQYGKPIQVLNNRDRTGLAGTYHGGGVTVTNIDMCRVLKGLKNEFPDEIEVGGGPNVELSSYNNLPLIFYVSKKPKPETLKLHKEVVFQTPGYKMWGVTDNTGYLGVLVQSPILRDMMGAQAGVMIYVRCGKAMGFGNFNPGTDEYTKDKHLYEPDNFDFVKPVPRAARKLSF